MSYLSTYSIAVTGTDYVLSIGSSTYTSPCSTTQINAYEGNSSYFYFGELGLQTLLDYSLCTSPTAASRALLITAIQALAPNSGNYTATAASTPSTVALRNGNGVSFFKTIYLDDATDPTLTFNRNSDFANLINFAGPSGGSTQGFITVRLPDATVNCSLVTTVDAQNIGGLKAFTTGLTLPTTGGTAATMDHYEKSYTHTTTWSQVYASPTSCNLNITRLGNSVLVHFPVITGSYSAGTGVFTMDTVLPARLRPTADLTFSGLAVVLNGTLLGTGTIFITASTGAIVIYRTPALAVFTTGVCGWTGFTLSWLTA
jgi:hypothetical protein